MNDNYVKDMWHGLSYACLQLGKGRASLPRVQVKLEKVLKEGAELAAARGITTASERVSVPAIEVPFLSQGVVVETITEAQIALAGGDLRRFVSQMLLGIAMVEAMQARGGNI
jgi:hypothetical protein